VGGSSRSPHYRLPSGGQQEPMGFLGKGDVMIHRPCLVAWPVGSDRRTRRPCLVPHCEDRSRTT
jgi:hypothetical protein